MPKCHKSDCNEEGVWIAMFIIWRKMHRGLPGKWRFNQPLCDQHKKETTLETELTDQNWETISKAIGVFGKEPPDRKLTELEFEKLSDIQHLFQ